MQTSNRNYRNERKCPPAASRRPGLSRNWTPVLLCATTTDTSSPKSISKIGTLAFFGEAHACAQPLYRCWLVSRYSFADTSCSICAHSTCALAPLHQDRAGMHTSGLCSQRGQERSWDHVRLYPADHARDNKAAGDCLASNRSTDRGGVQGTGSELRKGRQVENAVGHVKL
jgi:hypothetical protein